MIIAKRENEALCTSCILYLEIDSSFNNGDILDWPAGVIYNPDMLCRAPKAVDIIMQTQPWIRYRNIQQNIKINIESLLENITHS